MILGLNDLLFIVLIKAVIHKKNNRQLPVCLCLLHYYLKEISLIIFESIFTKNNILRMKKRNSFSIEVISLSVIFCLVLAGCTKEITTVTPAAIINQPQSSDKTTGSSAISSAINPSGFLGAYTVRDEKTIYIGQANPEGTNVLINLSYIDVPTTITPDKNNKRLTMPYGAAAYADSGWAYLIGYDAATKVITLAPNDAMIADIVPGSFETLFAFYDPKRKEGTFVTRFTTLRENGNETQLSENFFK